MALRKGQTVEFFTSSSNEWGNPAMVTSLRGGAGAANQTVNCTVFIDKEGDTTDYDPLEVDAGIAYRDSVTVYDRGEHLPSGPRAVAFAD